MTEREQFEKAFPVPDGAVWWDVIEAYCRKNKTTVHQYNDKWQAWQAARATPALPDGMAIVPVDKLPAAVAVELGRLRDFRSAVIGWRESDHPEGFCRKTAEFVTILGQIAAKDELK